MNDKWIKEGAQIKENAEDIAKSDLPVAESTNTVVENTSDAQNIIARNESAEMQGMNSIKEGGEEDSNSNDSEKPVVGDKIKFASLKEQNMDIDPATETADESLNAMNDSSSAATRPLHEGTVSKEADGSKNTNIDVKNEVRVDINTVIDSAKQKSEDSNNGDVVVDENKPALTKQAIDGK